MFLIDSIHAILAEDWKRWIETNKTQMIIIDKQTISVSLIPTPFALFIPLRISLYVHCSLNTILCQNACLCISSITPTIILYLYVRNEWSAAQLCCVRQYVYVCVCECIIFCHRFCLADPLNLIAHIYDTLIKIQFSMQNASQDYYNT